MTLLINALQYGPIGLATIMLFLVFYSLKQGLLSPEKTSLLKFFMVTGTICFFAACILAFFTPSKSVDHMVYFRVDPLDGGSRARFPKPLIKVNGRKLDPAQYLVTNDVTAIIDVNDAIDELQKSRADAVQQARAVIQLNNINQQAIALLSKPSGQLPGGANGAVSFDAKFVDSTLQGLKNVATRVSSTIDASTKLQLP